MLRRLFNFRNRSKSSSNIDSAKSVADANSASTRAGRRAFSASSSRFNRRLQLESLEGRALMAAAIMESLDLPSRSAEGEAAAVRIINGTVTTAYPSVGLIGDNTGYFCTGTLIAPQFVLTAAHCAEGVGNTSGRFQVGSSTYSTSQVFVHPSYNSNLIGDDNANDIAIYKLSTPVTNVAPSQIYRSTPTVGQILTLVGFGGGGTGNSGTDGSFGTKRVGTTPIDSVTPKMIRWTFDNNTESNTAPGDSGGPAFVTVAGSTFIAGITSGGELASAGIGDNSFDTRVDAFASWIDSIVGSSSSLPSVSIIASDNAAGETLSNQTANTGTYIVSRTGSTASALTVNIATSGSATNGSDYKSIPTSVIIPAGATSATITLTPIDDTIVESSETAVITLTTGAGYTVNSASSSALVTITDNDVSTSTNNDMFANRVALVGQTVSATGSNVTATKEKGEPNVAGVSGGKSVWWTWTAPVSGTVVINTTGSSFDTTLGVYRGTAVGSLTRVAANDDDSTISGALTSRVSFTATAGTVYQIVVDGYSGESGNIKLQLNQTGNRSASTKSVPLVSSTDVAVGASNNDRIRRNHFAPPVELNTHYNRHSRRVDQVFAGSIRDLF